MFIKTLLSMLALRMLAIRIISECRASSLPPTVLTKRSTDGVCDTASDANTLSKSGFGYHLQKSTAPNYYLAPGMGACGFNYTDNSDVVCISKGWITNGTVNHCNTWVQAYLPETGISVQGLVWEECAADKNAPTFGCQDIYLSKQLFKKLAGKHAEKAVDDGQLPGQVEWRFMEEPCFGCYMGLPGNNPDGSPNTCQGLDPLGNLRCGRKEGDQRLQQPDVDVVCNHSVQSCSSAEMIAETLHHYGKDDKVWQS